MFGALFSSRKRSRPERPIFRPLLESLENREVPSCAQVSAAFDQLPAAISNLQNSLYAHDAAAINTNLATVTNDLFLLHAGAGGFTTSDRLRIDGALFADGLRMIYSDFHAFPGAPIPQFLNVIEVGYTAAQQGAEDFLFASFFPQTSGDCTLM